LSQPWSGRMDNLGIFRKLASALEAGENVALVTVISTAGSSPGKVGYKMLVRAEGRETTGTVGGGLVEARMIEEATRMLAEPSSRVFRFDLGGTPADEKGICGGSVELFIEVFDKQALPLFEELSKTAENGDGGVLVSIVAPERAPQKIFLKDSGQSDPAARMELPPEIRAAVREMAAEDQGAVRVSAGGMDAFIEGVAKSPTVVIFGAGHVSHYIAEYAKSVHFRVVVCDDRTEYANRERFPDADDVIVVDFGRVRDKIRIDDSSYLVIVTRGHKCDALVLEQALKTNAPYVGMIGSKRKTTTILEELRQKGVPDALLNKVYSPIGLSIGAVTAQEIALSIVCELVKIRRLGRAARIRHMALARSGELAEERR
jgi:xanthine dehydrogenase accessory factor